MACSHAPKLASPQIQMCVLKEWLRMLPYALGRLTAGLLTPEDQGPPWSTVRNETCRW